MTYLKAAVKVLYWLAVAYMPVAIFQFERRYMEAIGCPAKGDCYVEGSEHLLSLDMLVVYSAAVLLPLAAWGIWATVRATITRGKRDT